MDSKYLKLGGAFLAGALLVAIFVAFLVGPGAPLEGPVARTYSTNVYKEQGGNKLVVASTGEIEVQSGGILDIQSGATTGWDAALDFDSTLNVDGAVTLNSTLDVDGNITSGTGGVTITDAIFVGTAGSGQDVQLFSATSGDHFLWDASEEALTIIGTAAQDALNIDDGNVDIADDVDIDGTLNADDADFDLTASFNIDGHMVDIGTGSYATADGDNDLGVAGDLEVDGATDLDGALDVDGNITSATGAVTVTDASGLVVTGANGLDVSGGSITLQNDETLDNSFDGTITATVAAAGRFTVKTGNLAVGDGAPGDSSMDGEDFYVEGESEFDGPAYFDGAVDFDSTLDMSNQVVSNIGAAGTDFDASGGLATANNITVTGNVSATALLSAGTFMEADPQSAQTIANGTGDVAPTGTYHQITSAGNVGNTLSVSGFSAGYLAVLVNIGSSTITITDTGTTMLTGNIALGQYDTLTLLFDGTNWLEISASDN